MLVIALLPCAKISLISSPNSIIFQDFHDHNTSEFTKATNDLVKDVLQVSLVTQNLLMYLCFGFLSGQWNETMAVFLKPIIKPCWRKQAQKYLLEQRKSTGSMNKLCQVLQVSCHYCDRSNFKINQTVWPRLLETHRAAGADPLSVGDLWEWRVEAVDVVGRGAGVATEELSSVFTHPAELHVMVVLLHLSSLAVVLLTFWALLPGLPLDALFLLELGGVRKEKKNQVLYFTLLNGTCL